MRVRFIAGEEGEVCTVFGQDFPFGVWVETDHPKLAHNPAFEVEGEESSVVGDLLKDLRAECDARGIKYHHKAGVEKLTALLAE
jgi:hypothetical protein